MKIFITNCSLEDLCPFVKANQWCQSAHSPSVVVGGWICWLPFFRSICIKIRLTKSLSKMGWYASVLVTANALVGIAEKLCPLAPHHNPDGGSCADVQEKRFTYEKYLFLLVVYRCFHGRYVKFDPRNDRPTGVRYFLALMFFEPSRRTRTGNFLSRRKISNYYARESYISTGI
jgi:hypothetical protein